MYTNLYSHMRTGSELVSRTAPAKTFKSTNWADKGAKPSAGRMVSIDEYAKDGGAVWVEPKKELFVKVWGR